MSKLEKLFDPDHFYKKKFALCLQCKGHGKIPMLTSDGFVWDDLAKCGKCKGKRVVEICYACEKEVPLNKGLCVRCEEQALIEEQALYPKIIYEGAT